MDSSAAFTATYNGQALEVNQRSGLYYVDVVGIAAKDLDEDVTITISDGVSTTDVSFNPMSYCQGVLNDTTDAFDQEMKDLVAALYLYNQAAKLIDKQYVKSVLETAKAADLAAELSELANGWFGEGEFDAVRSNVEKYIVQSGLHGNRLNELDNRLKKTFDSTVRFAKLRFFLRRFLGTKEILYKSYPILERRKILYPICWLHRAFRALQPKKVKRLTREVKAVMDTKSQQ